MHAEAECLGRPVGVAQGNDGAAGARAPVEAQDALAAGERGLEEAEMAERCKPGRLEEESRSDGTDLRRTFEDDDVVTAPAQHEGRRESCNARADDGYAHRV